MSTSADPSRSIAANDRRRPELLRLTGDRVDPVGREHDQLGREQRQKGVAKVPHEFLGDRAGVTAEADRVAHRREHPTRITLDQPDQELVEVDDLTDVAPGGRQQFERRERVASRTTTLGQGGVESRLRQFESGFVGDPPNVFGEDLGRQQMELQVLCARANRVTHLLGIRGRQHEHDVRWWLLERLQQCRLGGLREHVDLVEDVHLVAPRRAERGLLDQIPDRVDAVVGGGVELVDVIARAALDRQARCALAARLAVDDVVAVQDLGEDARRGRLARAAWPGEQVGLTFPTGRDGVAQRHHDVILALEFAEPTWPISAVEGLGRHRGEPTQWVLDRARPTRMSPHRGDSHERAEGPCDELMSNGGPPPWLPWSM